MNKRDREGWEFPILAIAVIFTVAISHHALILLVVVAIIYFLWRDLKYSNNR